eukprot:TRINITY_DN936_c0_g1_i3.p1 TRINITY_DN936_c0_g1~~TRINITY_DN936_c0_g1_i3.p1  ORF type:complete len:374 (-),score=75.20 TRINITY_DN936_c0_g1_i3:39-1160(-)
MNLDSHMTQIVEEKALKKGLRSVLDLDAGQMERVVVNWISSTEFPANLKKVTPALEDITGKRIKRYVVRQVNKNIVLRADSDDDALPDAANLPESQAQFYVEDSDHSSDTEDMDLATQPPVNPVRARPPPQPQVRARPAPIAATATHAPVAANIQAEPSQRTVSPTVPLREAEEITATQLINDISFNRGGREFEDRSRQSVSESDEEGPAETQATNEEGPAEVSQRQATKRKFRATMVANTREASKHHDVEKRAMVACKKIKEEITPTRRQQQKDRNDRLNRAEKRAKEDSKSLAQIANAFSELVASHKQASVKFDSLAETTRQIRDAFVMPFMMPARAPPGSHRAQTMMSKAAAAADGDDCSADDSSTLSMH